MSGDARERPSTPSDTRITEATGERLARGGATRRGSRAGAWFWGGAVAGAAPFLLAITLLGRAAQNMAQTTYPLIARDLLDVSNSTLGAMPAAAGLASVVVAATVATRTTARSAFAMLAVGEVLFCGAFALFALRSGILGLWTGTLMLGIGGGLVMPSTMTMVGWGPPQRRARALAIFALALSGGLVFGPLVESGVLRLLGGSLRATFAAMLPLPLVATLLVAAGIARAPSGRIVAFDDSTDAERKPEPHPRARGTPATALAAARQPLLRFSAYRVALATMLTYQAPFAALVTFAALLARRVDGTSAAGASLAFAAFFLVSLVARAAVLAASPIRRPNTVLGLSVCLTAAGLVALVAGRGGAYLIAGMATLGAPHGLTFPMATATLAEGVPPSVLGRANARLMAATNLVSMVVPFGCGWLAATLGYRAMFLTLEVPVVGFGALLLSSVRSGAAPRSSAEIPGSAYGQRGSPPSPQSS